MADEYNELEQLVNDVTSIDTARMTLRWALERLNGIEKERAELKKNLGLSEGDRKQLEARVRELEESFRSRSKTLDEKEGFYSKLEATMSLLGEGKLDLQQLLRKETRLDQLRGALEEEYQAKFEELDRKQKGVIERWSQRLLDVETQYAARLSSAQAKYDSLRSEVEAEHQSRLTSLEKNYKSKEAELRSRIEMLEKSVRGSEGGIESRRKELESEFLAKKTELEGGFRRLRSELELSLDARVRSVDGEHAEQLRSLESTWSVERSRLIEEQRVREEQFRCAQEKIRELENSLAEVQERSSEEVMRQLAKKDEFFRARLAELESATAAFAAREAELAASYEAALEKRASEIERRYSAQVSALGAELEAERARGAAIRLESQKRASAVSSESAERIKELEHKIIVLEAGARAERDAALASAHETFRAREEEFSSALEAQKNLRAAEKERLEALAAGAEKSAGSARAEVRALLEANRRAGEELVAAEGRFSRELGEARAAAEKEALARIEEAVAGRTAALSSALAELKSLKTDLEDKVSGLENDLAAAKAAAVNTERECRARQAFEESSALSEKVAELEGRYQARRTELEEETAQLHFALEAEYTRKAGQSGHSAEMRLTQLREENEALRANIAALRGEAAAAGTRAAGVFDELMRKVREHKEETLALRESHAAELDARTRAAVEKATEGVVRKIAMAEEELSSMRDDYELELSKSREAAAAEKDRLLAELSRREKYAEAAGLKIADLERQLIAHRQEAAETVVKQLAGQEEKFKDVIAEFQKRQLELEEGYFRQVEQTRRDYEERLARLEELAASKDRTLKEREAVYGRKHLDLDARQAELAARAEAVDRELGEMRRAAAARERDLETRRLELDKDYARKCADLEKMRIELSRAIAEYKGRK